MRPRVIQSFPLDAPPPKSREQQRNLHILEELGALDKADDDLFFGALEKLRAKEKHNLHDSRPLKHKAIAEASLLPIKDTVRCKIIHIRTGKSDEEDDSAIREREKKVKFVNFILNLHQKNAFRTWRQNVFGLGGDPRIA